MENNKKKIITIIPIIISMLSVITLGTFALLLWSSTENTELTMRIGEIAEVVFPPLKEDTDPSDGITISGNNVSISNIGPIFDYEQDGEIVEFSIISLIDDKLKANASFHITEISDNLKEESFKLVVLHSTDKITYTEIKEVNFSTATSDSDINLFSDLTVTDKDFFKVIIYIDGNMNNPITMQGGSLSGYISVEVDLPKDLNITNITLAGNSIESLPTTGLYSMTSNCDNVTYDRFTKKVKISDYTSSQSCSLDFVEDTNYPFLNTMQVGDYVAYVGNNGCLNGVSGTTGESDAEAGNSCLGENANQSEDTSNYTYGYCASASYKYYVYGWRIAYIEDNKVHLVSAGSPECRTRTSSTGNATQITDLNTAALDYCNSTYVDGGICSSSNTWAMGNSDFYQITEAISGTGSNLTSAYGTTYCYYQYSYKRCGYNNDLIDNGGIYWFAAYDSTSSSYGVVWDSGSRNVHDDKKAAHGFRPIIRLSSSIYVTGGSGTMDDPYTIGI